jgi:PAS domain S-box-containing protein
MVQLLMQAGESQPTGCAALFRNMPATDEYQFTPDFQTLFEAAPSLYLVLLPDVPRFTIVAVSDAYADATSSSRGEILGRGFFEVFPDHLSDPTAVGVAKLRASLEQVLTSHLPDRVPAEEHDIQGPAEFGRGFEKRWWSSKNSPVLGPRGDVVYIIHDIEDVTEQHRLAEERQQFAALFALATDLFDQASDSIFIADLHGRLLDVNASACRMLGYAREELIGRSIRDSVAPEDVPRLVGAREYLLSSGTVQVAEWTILRKDGTRIPVEASAKILPDGRWQAIVRDISERKQAETALKESEQRLNLALDSSGIGMWDLDLLADTSVRSLRHDQIFGYSSMVPDWGMAVFFTHVVPEDRAIAQRAFETAFRTGNFEMECRILWADTSIHWISASGRVYRNEQGEPVRMMGTVADVTERKRIEAELRNANAYFDAIIENIPLMLFIKDGTSLRFLRFNRAGEELLGWPRERFLGKTDYDFWPREQAEFFVGKDRETLTGGKVVDIAEEPIQTPHHGVRLLHTKKVPILDQAGQPSHLLGISEDITERKRTEKERQLLVDASVMLSASLDYESTIATLAQFVAENVAEWCAIDVMEEDGRLRRLKVASPDPLKAELCPVLEDMPPNRELPHLMQSVIESKRPQVVEHASLSDIESLAQGPEHLKALLATGITSFVVVPLLAGGQSLGAIFLGSSTSSHVCGNGDLQLAEALADRAAMAIVNARLYRASVHASQLRDQVLSIVAHDLRNPLSTILLQTAALRRQGPEPERRSQKPEDAIYSAATRMNRLIQDLLDVALMESGQMTVERGRLSARELIVGAVEMLRPVAASSGLELRVDVEDDVPDVLGDRDRLLQVLENLIGNAIKFTQPGGSVVVRASPGDRGVLFWVTDTGSGIAAEHLPLVFDRFWQATRTTRVGAGLGLPIAKGIVEAHGGRIGVESTQGRGTTVWFTIHQV